LIHRDCSGLLNHQKNKFKKIAHSSYPLLDEEANSIEHIKMRNKRQNEEQLPKERMKTSKDPAQSKNKAYPKSKCIKRNIDQGIRLGVTQHTPGRQSPITSECPITSFESKEVCTRESTM